MTAAALQPLLLEGMREEIVRGAFDQAIDAPPQDVVLFSLGLSAATLVSALVLAAAPSKPSKE